MLVGFFFSFFFPEIRQAKIKSLFEMRTEEMVLCFPVRVLKGILSVLRIPTLCYLRSEMVLDNRH